MDQDDSSKSGQNSERSDALNSSTRKPIRYFSFGHGNVKTFHTVSDKSYAKQLTKKSKIKKTTKNVLDNEKMVEDLLENLPQ